MSISWKSWLPLKIYTQLKTVTHLCVEIPANLYWFYHLQNDGSEINGRKLMHTTTSWSSPPPAWRVWEMWGRKHSVWSSTRCRGARRAAGTRSPVPASYRCRSEGGRERQTDARQPVWRFAFCSSPRLKRTNTEARRDVGGSRITQRKNRKVYVGPSHRRWGCCSACGD